MERASTRRIVVIGGGAAGLSTALALLDTCRSRGGVVAPPGGDSSDGVAVTVLEAREQIGGRIGSEQHGGFSVETGPATLQENAPGLLELVARLGLQKELVVSDERANRRYLWRAGRLRRLPGKPQEVLTSDALSLPARLRLLTEPLVPPRRALPAAGTGDAAPLPEETVAQFCRRRLGTRITAEVVDPFISGIYAGDIEQLSMQSAMPRLVAMEAQHGSLLKALKSARRESAGTGPRQLPRLCGFRHGLGQLVGALGHSVIEGGGEIRVATRVHGLHRDGGGFRVVTEGAELAADRVVLALPPPEAAALAAGLDDELRGLYQSIPMAPVVAITLGWPREQVPHPLDGFGFLVPRQAGLRLLGTLFMTSILPDCEQAPRGQVILRAMYGGAHDPSICELDDGALLDLVRRDLKTTLGVLAEPRFIHIQRWPRAIEQYLVGHAARIAALEARALTLGGLYPVGAALRGVSVPDVLRQGQALGARLGAELVPG
ncbi:MAG: protoporphyrinogen oxidase [Polyangia bacterium]